MSDNANLDALAIAMDGTILPEKQVGRGGAESAMAGLANMLFEDGMGTDAGPVAKRQMLCQNPAPGMETACWDKIRPQETIGPQQVQKNSAR